MITVQSNTISSTIRPPLTSSVDPYTYQGWWIQSLAKQHYEMDSNPQCPALKANALIAVPSEFLPSKKQYKIEIM